MPVAFVVVDMMSFFGLVTMPLLRRLHGRQTGRRRAAEHPLRMWLILPTDYGVFCWMFVLLAWPRLFLAATAMFVVNTLVMVPVLAKWWRELRVMDRAVA